MSSSELYVSEVTMHNRLQERRSQHEASRTARRMREDLNSGNRLTSPLLGWVGSRLVSWGSRLQERYSVAAATRQPANPVLS